MKLFFLENQTAALTPLLPSATMALIMSPSEPFGHCFRFKTTNFMLIKKLKKVIN